MLFNESNWIGDILLKITGENQMRLLNIGSSTLHFRTVEQPHIHANVFARLRPATDVVHLDMKKSEGVDIVGNLMDEQFLASLKSGFDIALCSNLLEHVTEPQLIIDKLEEVVRPGGYIIVSGPYLFPYHNDPIDTMFRPSVKELAAMFHHCELVEGSIISEQDSHFDKLKSSPVALLKFGARLLTPFYKFNSWKKLASGLPHFFRKFEVVAVLLRRR
ncbi:MAG: methyltransferase domain-containing protein [Chitinophagaceae bacterium]|nr:MAG: methyltransferase domain-containing protein [Chitinophagaceae bacterium]